MDEAALMNLTKREVKGRYSQSFFGVAWAIVQPLSAMVVFTIAIVHAERLSHRAIVRVPQAAAGQAA